MAIITLKTNHVNQSNVLTWENMAAGDSGAPARVSGGALAACVQLVDAGSFVGTVTMEGSLDGVNWATLNDVVGAAIDLTATGLTDFATAATFIRPNFSAGAGTATIMMRVRA